MTTPETLPCRYCGKPTRMLATRECDPCWELASKVKANPELARKVLREVSQEKARIAARVAGEHS